MDYTKSPPLDEFMLLSTVAVNSSRPEIAGIYPSWSAGFHRYRAYYQSTISFLDFRISQKPITAKEIIQIKPVT